MNGTGTLTACYAMTFRRHTNQSPRRMREAITEPRAIEAWMGSPATVDLRPGGDYRIDFSATNEGELDGVIVRIEPEARLAYVWGLSVVEWRLELAADGGCDYIVVQTGLADRDEDEEGLPAGWHEFLDRLDDHVAGRPQPAMPARESEWRRLKPAYRSQLDAVLPGRE